MNDYLRESMSYFGIYKKLAGAKKTLTPERVSFGRHKDQYFLYYEPKTLCSDKVIVWVHGGGWNAGSPDYFDFVGQCIAGAGYRFVSLGYRLSPANKYPRQIIDVCRGYKAAMEHLREKGIDTSRVIVSGPSAGAHLSSILCYSKAFQKKLDVDVSNVIGYIGVGGPYCFSEKTGLTLKLLLDQLFRRDYDRRKGEPVSLMGKSNIPMLLIQSRHDGLMDYACAESFCRRAEELGNSCELYEVEDEKNTHSWYTAGCFLFTREENRTLDKFFSWIEAL